MFYLKRTMTTETAHSLIGHEGLCQYVHGHSYKWTVTVASEKLTDGMVMDFGHLKQTMNSIIGRYDHAIVMQAPNTDREKAIREYSNTRIILVPYRPTAENMAQNVFRQLCEYGVLPSGISVISVECRETENNTAIYQP